MAARRSFRWIVLAPAAAAHIAPRGDCRSDLCLLAIRRSRGSDRLHCVPSRAADLTPLRRTTCPPADPGWRAGSCRTASSNVRTQVGSSNGRKGRPRVTEAPVLTGARIISAEKVAPRRTENARRHQGGSDVLLRDGQHARRAPQSGVAPTAHAAEAANNVPGRTQADLLGNAIFGARSDSDISDGERPRARISTVRRPWSTSVALEGDGHAVRQRCSHVCHSDDADHRDRLPGLRPIVLRKAHVRGGRDVVSDTDSYHVRRSSGGMNRGTIG